MRITRSRSNTWRCSWVKGIVSLHLTATRVPLVISALVAFCLVAAACASSDTTGHPVAPPTWNEVLADADGQTVQLWMWGGDAVLNAYIEDHVVPCAAAKGVVLEQVRLDVTEDGIARIVSEIEAGTTDGAVDLLWVNGKNFAQGQEAGLWLEAWVSLLPNASLLDAEDPTLFTDFGVATNGQEAPWSRAAFTFVYDTERVAAPPTNFEELAEWIEANPGRFTYPAPPDFTGSAFVRQAVQALGEEEAFEFLQRIEADLWSNGQTYPADENELNQLFGNGEVDIAMSYNPNFVHVKVEQGLFASTSRPFIFESGTLQNVSFLAIASNAGSSAAAMVVVNEMLDPELQALKLELVGVPAVVDISTEVLGSDYRLTDFGTPLAELPATEVPRIDERWRQDVLS
ncbi:MAG: putative spermidine/putrescine transport system substrate-binding protein [Acidimicrobiales bacterium]|jgi:putative spermidine/putrescine transport system substrate-binding protein